jgi:deoxycytidylate deaminase
MNKYLRLAAKFCYAHKQDETLEYNLCAIIVRGGSVLSVGYNSRSNSALQEFYKTQEYSCTLHAEVDAILRVRRKIDLRGSKIYVVRLLQNNRPINPTIADYSNAARFGMARPCLTCQIVLGRYGVRKMCYTISNGFAIEKIVEPTLPHYKL